MNIGVWSYLTLIFLGLLALGLALWKKTLKLLVLYFAVSGITLFFDYIIYVWGKAYNYYPGFIEGKFDTHIGGIVNGHLLPSFAVLYVALKFKWFWAIILAAFFTGIELLFSEWGIFKSNWWSPWYTIIGLTFYFLIAKNWWKRLNQSYSKWLVFGTLVSIFYSIFITLNVFLYGILKSRIFHVVWIENLHRDSTAFNSFTAILFGAILAYFALKRTRNSVYLFIMISFIAYDFFLKYVNIVKTEKIILDPILSFTTFYLALIFVRYSYGKLINEDN